MAPLSFRNQECVLVNKTSQLFLVVSLFYSRHSEDGRFSQFLAVRDANRTEICRKIEILS